MPVWLNKRLPTLRVGSKRPAYVDPQEFEAIYRSAPDCLWRAFLGILYTTALRLREAMNLTWHDLDFESSEVHVTREAEKVHVQASTPKDHEMRSVPMPEEVVDLLAAWPSVAPEGCPYVFMEHGRWEHYGRQVDHGCRRAGQDLVNNLLCRFKTLCRRASVGPYMIDDLRRSCIPNWDERLPIHVVKKLAGDSDIKTTQQFYLSVQQDDLKKAKRTPSDLPPHIVGADLTDPKATHSGEKRRSPGRRGVRRKKEALD